MATYTRYQGNRSDGYRPNDEFYTPAWIFERLGLTFDLDVAAPEGGVDWIPKRGYFTKEIDGLSQQWHGRVWMNPPFSQSKPWVKKFIDHGNGIALLPASKARWFTELWQVMSGMVWLPYDLKFIYQHQTTNGIFMPTGLFAMGEDNKQALERLELGKVR